MLLQNCPIWPINHFCLFLRGHGWNNVISDLSFLTTINTWINVHRRKDFNKYPTLENKETPQEIFRWNQSWRMHGNTTGRPHSTWAPHFKIDLCLLSVCVCVCVCVALCVLLWLYKGRRRNCMNLPPGLLSFMTPRDTCKATKTFKTRLIQNKPFWFWQLTAINSYSNTDGFAPRQVFSFLWWNLKTF